jgi:hypothetical protein
VEKEFALREEVAAGEIVVSVAPIPGGDVRMNVASIAAMSRIEHFLARGTTSVKPHILANCSLSFPPVPGQDQEPAASRVPVFSPNKTELAHAWRGFQILLGAAVSADARPKRRLLFTLSLFIHRCLGTARLDCLLQFEILASKKKRQQHSNKRCIFGHSEESGPSAVQS